MEPGHVHYRIAGEVLRGIQQRAADAGIGLDIGQIPDVNGDGDDEGDDPEKLSRITARIVARIGDRVGIFRRISRHLEGQEKRSGLLSDMSAAAIELYKRNPDTFHSLGKQAANDFSTRRMQRAASKEPTNQHNGGLG